MVQGGRAGAYDPYIQTLQAAGVPPDRILREAEAGGYAPGELLALADRLAPRRAGGDSMAALCLALGAAERWEPFVPAALAAGLKLLDGLLFRECSDLDPLATLLGPEPWDRIRTTVLERLGHPLDPVVRGSSEVVARLEQDLGLILDGLEATGFRSRAGQWRQLRVEALSLRDGAGPKVLSMGPFDCWFQGGDARTVRLHRLRRLRSLEGLGAVTSLVAVDCPDLADLDAAPSLLVLKGCPGLRRIPSRTSSILLHLQDCPNLASLDVPFPDSPWGRGVKPTYRNVLLSDLPALRELPSEMRVSGRMILRRMGSIRRWPEVWSAGDLTLRDCPAIEELPPLDVVGSLRVEGASGLRRLAPGTVVGRHLDLRACANLEGVPRGVKVGGALLLPAHLHREAACVEQEPLLEAPVDRYPVLRTLLLGLGFQRLSTSAERLATREQAEAALAELRREVRQDPRVETELVWTASEVWRDLSEELWAEEHPFAWGRNEADDDLPLAWFRGLLLSA